ncbi:MAG: bifunctional 4-hydroxy-2-oxoglutarate aldolase/2-dehydro-3-deoxy-phosphogluconate aldolase [Pseudomonadota bacterium]
MLTAKDVCLLAPVIPVLVVKELSIAQALAQALVQGGLPALEVTLRTRVALEVIRAMADVEGGVVGAGTLLTPADVKAAKAAGARFGVSPGVTDSLLKAAEDADLPLLAGAATASEVMYLLERGYDTLKLFPAEAVGGVALLKSLASPLPQVTFCPTGGITLQTAPQYLALPNVLCVGGSWVAPDTLIQSQDWQGIQQLAREAAGLAR